MQDLQPFKRRHPSRQPTGNQIDFVGNFIHGYTVPGEETKKPTMIIGSTRHFPADKKYWLRPLSKHDPELRQHATVNITHIETIAARDGTSRFTDRQHANRGKLAGGVLQAITLRFPLSKRGVTHRQTSPAMTSRPSDHSVT